MNVWSVFCCVLYQQKYRLVAQSLFCVNWVQNSRCPRLFFLPFLWSNYLLVDFLVWVRVNKLGFDIVLVLVTFLKYLIKIILCYDSFTWKINGEWFFEIMSVWFVSTYLLYLLHLQSGWGFIFDDVIRISKSC